MDKLDIPCPQVHNSMALVNQELQKQLTKLWETMSVTPLFSLWNAKQYQTWYNA